MLSPNRWESSFFSSNIKQYIITKITESLANALKPPQLPRKKVIPRWTLKRFITHLKDKFDIACSRETVRKVLINAGFSWKKARKILNKANPKERESFVQTLKLLLDDATHNKRILIYIDEAHIGLDTSEGYGWSVLGKRFWVSSHSPGLAKVSFYGVYIYNYGQVSIYPYDKANTENTVEVLEKIRQKLPHQNITIIWDGATYHRSRLVKEVANKLHIDLQALPSYSPDFMPVEHLWSWLREEICYHTCYNTKQQLIDEAQRFKKRINLNPINIADRLWTKTQLNQDEEKMRFSM